jgi:multisubunit Na+/H+ antiporter MnhB subunit
MAFLLTVATSFFLLDRRSLAFSIPFVLGYGVLIVLLGYHDPGDLLFAAGLAVPVTLACHHIRFRKCFGGSGDRL